MKVALRIGSAAAALSVAAPAQAAVTITGGAVTVTAVGDTFDVAFNGLSNGQVVPGLSGILTLTVASIGRTFGFNYSLNNTGAGDITGFGFDVAPNVTGLAATGTYGNEGLGFQAASFSAETCFSAGNGNCPNGNAQNVADPGTGTLALSFGSVQSEVTLSNFLDRTQGFQIGNVSSAVGQGTPTPSVPEPATWAMMLVGFGFLGAAMRRRPQLQQRVRFAM